MASISGAVGRPPSRLLTLTLQLGALALALSLIAMFSPDNRSKAEFLSSIPRLVTFDSSQLVDTATAFDDDPSTFSLNDLNGITSAISFALFVFWAMSAVAAGSYHAAVGEYGVLG